MATQQADQFGTPPTTAGQTSAVSQPIGVPFYAVDPNTGQPYPDSTQPGGFARWGAVVPAPATGPGSLGTQGPGTAPSSGAQYVLPRYFDGAQWLPAQLPPDKLAALQRKMVSSGLLKAGTAQLGVWDQASMEAYTRLLAYANASGLDAQTALDRWGQQHAAAPPGQGLPTQVTSLDDLRPAIRQAFIDTLGTGISQDQVDALARQFQSMQSGAQQQANAAADTGGGTITQPPTVQNFAEAQARAQNPAQAGEHDIIKPGGPLDAFKQILGGWS